MVVMLESVSMEEDEMVEAVEEQDTDILILFYLKLKSSEEPEVTINSAKNEFEFTSDIPDYKEKPADVDLQNFCVSEAAAVI